MISGLTGATAPSTDCALQSALKASRPTPPLNRVQMKARRESKTSGRPSAPAAVTALGQYCWDVVSRRTSRIYGREAAPSSRTSFAGMPNSYVCLTTSRTRPRMSPVAGDDTLIRLRDREARPFESTASQLISYLRVSEDPELTTAMPATVLPGGVQQDRLDGRVDHFVHRVVERGITSCHLRQVQDNGHGVGLLTRIRLQRSPDINAVEARCIPVGLGRISLPLDEVGLRRPGHLD